MLSIESRSSSKVHPPCSGFTLPHGGINVYKCTIKNGPPCNHNGLPWIHGFCSSQQRIFSFHQRNKFFPSAEQASYWPKHHPLAADVPTFIWLLSDVVIVGVTFKMCSYFVTCICSHWISGQFAECLSSIWLLGMSLVVKLLWLLSTPCLPSKSCSKASNALLKRSTSTLLFPPFPPSSSPAPQNILAAPVSVHSGDPPLSTPLPLIKNSFNSEMMVYEGFDDKEHGICTGGLTPWLMRIL